jgi:protein SCO1/2
VRSLSNLPPGGLTPDRRAARFPRARCLAVIGLLVLAPSCRDARGVQKAGEWRGTLLSEPLEKVAFTLTDTNGEPWDFRRHTDGRLTFLFFGFTNCPDVCPVHMANLAATLARMPFETRNGIRVVFVTTDPARDSLTVIRAWLDRFDRDFIGLRGDSAQVARIQDELRMATTVRGPTAADGSYTVGHAAQVVAFTADNRAHIVYPFGTRQEDWLHDIPRLLRADW